MILGTRGTYMIAFRLPSCLGGLFLAFLMLFCSQSWAACYQRQRSATIRSAYYCGATSGTYNFCYPVSDRISVSGQCHCSSNTLAPYSYTIELCVSTGSRIYAGGSCTSSCYEENQSNSSYYFRVQCVSTECDTQAEADSAYCALNPTAEGCVEEDVPQACEEQYSSCMNAGGVWKKVGTSGNNCTSVCDLCGSGNAANFMNRLNSYCCNQPGMAPPDSAAQCYTPTVIQNDMVVSTIVSSRNEVIAGCSPMTTSDGQIIDESAANYKRFCIDGDEYEEQVDTNDVGSGEGSSSSEVESSASGTSFGTELEALGGVYGVLDTIRDTLVKRLTPATEEIRDCLYNARLCLAFDSIKVDWSNMPKDSSWLRIDTTLLKYIRPLMDSSVALDSHQLKALRNLDTNMLKQMALDTAMLKLDSAMLRNDSSTRKAIVSGDSGIMKRVGNVDTSVRRLDSSLTKSLGGIDTTLHSLDSSLNNGLRDGVDSLIDSMSRYIGRVDSSIRGIGGDGTPLGDSLGKLIGILGGLDTGSVGSGPYGDSARALGDSIRKWIGQGESQWDSAFRATEGEWGVDTIDGLYDSSFSYGTCHGDDCPPCTDSDCLGKITPDILKYGDSVAALLGDTLAKSVKAQQDTLPRMWDSAMAKLREVSFFSAFDSTFLANIGSKIPNTNTCPEDCFRHQVDGRYAYVAYNMTLDWKLCRPIAPGVLNGLNAFDILKLLARVLTVVTCLSILMWEVSSRRGGGIGL